MEAVGGQDRGTASSVRSVALAGLIGTTIEWYDFVIYSTAAALVFGPLFFPEFSATAGTLAAFSTFAIGFFARPVGGVVFGHYGDRIGRKAMLVVSLIMVGLATFAIGLLPTYAAIGVAAPILLVALRFVQGFGLGGEWGGAVLLTIEHAPPNRRGFYGSFPQIGVPAGLILANVVFLAVAGLPEEQFLAWGWRVPFLFSIVLVLFGLFVRLRIMESPAFRRVRESNTESRMPVMEALRSYPKRILLGAGMYIAVNACFYVIITFTLNYGTQTVGVSSSTMLFCILAANVVHAATLMGSAALSDRIGRRPLYLGGLLLTGLWAFPYFSLLNTGSVPLILLAITLGLVFLSMAYGPLAAFFPEMYGTRVRFSGVSLSYQGGSVFGGALAPFIATALLAAFGTPLAISWYMAAACAFSIVCVLLTAETFRNRIAEDVSPASGEAPATDERPRSVPGSV